MTTDGELVPRRPATLTARDPWEAWLAAWLAGYGSRNTRAAYARDLADYAGWLATHQMDPLLAGRVHIDLYIRDLTEGRGLAQSTASRRLNALSSFHSYLIGEDVIGRNPVAHIRRPKLNRDHSDTVGLSREDARAYTAAARRHSPRAYALVTLLLHNGLRISEATGARADALGAERGHRTLTVLGKGSQHSTVPLAPVTAEALDLYLLGRVTGPLLVTRTGRALTTRSATVLVRALARKAQVHAAEKISPHSLRHTAITAGLDAGVSLRDMQDFARHTDPRTTRRYDRNRNNLDRHATYAVAAYLA